MPARSKIDQLPPQTREKIERLMIERGFSGYDGMAEEANAIIAGDGYEIVLSRSGLARHGQEFEAKCDAIRIATEQAKAIVGVAGDDEGNLNQSLILMIQQLTYDILVRTKPEEIGDILPKIGLMVSKLSKASVDQRKYRREIRKQALEEAAGKAPRLVSGVSGEGVRELLREAFALVRRRRGEVVEDDDEDTPAPQSEWRP